MKYFPIKIVFFSKRNMQKCQTAGSLVIRRLYPVVSGEIFEVSRLDLFVLCVQGRRRLRIVNEGKEKLVYFKEKYGVI